MPAEALKREPAAKTAESTEPVFVFGTDLAGEHKNENAAFAVDHHGAERGKGSGISGNAYAIPFRNSQGAPLPPEVIGNYVESFLTHARAHTDISFQVARFGCEPGVHTDDTMAQLFAKRPANCALPGLWTAHLDAAQPARVLLLDPGAHMKDPALQTMLQSFFDLNVPLWGVPGIELVSVGLARTLVANDSAARALGLKHRVIGVKEAHYGRQAPQVAEARAIWYATHLISVMDFEQTAQPQQIRVMGAATRAGLAIEQIDASAV